MQDYTKLLVWERARALTVSMDEVCRSFDRQAAPGLRAQLMRATMSISANVAEGAGRESRTEFARFVTIAIGSTSEVIHHLVVAEDLALLDRIVAARLIDRATELRRMLFGLRRALLAKESEARSAKTGPNSK